MSNDSDATTKPEPLPAVRYWLAVGSYYHTNFFEWHETEQDAAGSLDAGEENGDCYATAIYHVLTGTLKMRDVLHRYDPAKVRASIEEFLTANERRSGAARDERKNL